MQNSKKFLLIISILISRSLLAQQVNKNIINENILVCWRVKDYRLEKAVALTDREIKNFSKREVCLNNDKLELIIDTIMSPKYSITTFNSEKYLWDTFRYTKKHIGIETENLYEISVKGKSSNKKIGEVAYSFLYDGNYLYFIEDGVIFRLYKPKSSPNRSSSH